MNEFLTQSLNQIVHQRYRASLVFEKFNLDYCCMGHRSLQQACKEENIPAVEVLEDLQTLFSAQANEADYSALKLCELADDIVHTHHNYIKQEIPRILSYFDKIVPERGRKNNELGKIERLFRDLSEVLTRNMQYEETILFPRIKQIELNRFTPLYYDNICVDYLLLPIIDMEDDHENAVIAIKDIKKITNNYVPPENACSTFKLLYVGLHAFEIDLHRHIYLETNILFHKALLLEKELKHNDAG